LWGGVEKRIRKSINGFGDKVERKKVRLSKREVLSYFFKGRGGRRGQRGATGDSQTYSDHGMIGKWRLVAGRDRRKKGPFSSPLFRNVRKRVKSSSRSLTTWR